MTKTQIVTLPTAELRAIVRSTKPDTDLFQHELMWARDELARRSSR
jgi:hypothetical protein